MLVCWIVKEHDYERGRNEVWEKGFSTKENAARAIWVRLQEFTDEENDCVSDQSYLHGDYCKLCGSKNYNHAKWNWNEESFVEAFLDYHTAVMCCTCFSIQKIVVEEEESEKNAEKSESEEYEEYVYSPKEKAKLDKMVADVLGNFRELTDEE